MDRLDAAQIDQANNPLRALIDSLGDFGEFKFPDSPAEIGILRKALQLLLNQLTNAGVGGLENVGGSEFLGLN